MTVEGRQTDRWPGLTPLLLGVRELTPTCFRGGREMTRGLCFLQGFLSVPVQKEMGPGKVLQVSVNGGLSGPL